MGPPGAGPPGVGPPGVGSHRVAPESEKERDGKGVSCRREGGGGGRVGGKVVKEIEKFSVKFRTTLYIFHQ